MELCPEFEKNELQHVYPSIEICCTSDDNFYSSKNFVLSVSKKLKLFEIRKIVILNKKKLKNFIFNFQGIIFSVLFIKYF